MTINLYVVCFASATPNLPSLFISHAATLSRTFIRYSDFISDGLQVLAVLFPQINLFTLSGQRFNADRFSKGVPVVQTDNFSDSKVASQPGKNEALAIFTIKTNAQGLCQFDDPELKWIRPTWHARQNQDILVNQFIVFRAFTGRFLEKLKRSDEKDV